ncbi:DUF2157 domain-containing protein [Iningainema tapete]|uniref:DUF2157 domain-containing protein n=1 Tax=Iningainema tapete BLCC-T55 TaxID=2748662 RepID=A0A8J7BX35_9CYAN|nr:DUF2157 domain-containing protein [Iningainema tapete]MBD2772158.1 DUF2157 domain-containing protein [Iningainema tapete BLCC-T55]
MSSTNRLLKIEINLNSYHPELLSGLDIWLRLGLISDAQVRQICRELVCSVVLQQKTIPAQQEIATVETLPALPATKKPTVLARMLQSLGAELSVRWLLFLGMFLVVLSSGVLAASQWEKFPPSFQYGVLLAYTSSFSGLTFWAGRQPNLSLTSRTLLIVTLLLVPVNFWAMDSFRLNWIVVGSASVILTAITVLMCNHRLFIGDKPMKKLLAVNILGLSYLNLGWQIPGFPLIAIYVAIALTSIVTIYHTQQRQITAEGQTGLGIVPSSVIIYALALLMLRAIFIVHVDVQQLGLAIGICGALVALVAQPWEFVGAVLMFCGWLVSVVTIPWQATAVSILGWWFCHRRLQRHGVWMDVAAIFAIGLETIWLGWRLVPSPIQQQAIATATQLTHAQNTPWALLSVALFPYVIFMLAKADRLQRCNKLQLADFAEELTLVFGSLLTLISLVNPTLRSLNLLFSTITLVIVNQRHSRISLVYMTQIALVLTLCSIIDLFKPSLTQQVWASILLALAVAEWLFSLRNGIWQRSSWHIGLGLATLSYSLLWVNAGTWYGSGDNSDWGLIWLITPMTLTGIASLGFKNPNRAIHPITSSWLSVAAIFVSQLLTLPLPGARLIGLAVATALMFVNTSNLKYFSNSVITVGYGLSFIAAVLWEGMPGLPRLSLQGWFLVGAISIFGLWQVRKLSRRGNNELVAIYATATDKWAISLCSAQLLLLSVQSFLVYQGLAKPEFLYLTSGAIILAAIFDRSWQQLTNWGFYGIAWCIELLIAQALGFGNHSPIKMAIANIALGLITQLLGEWWQRRHPQSKLTNHWHILPLLYSVFGLALRSSTFANWTGLSELAVALIAIGVGRRQRELKPLVYLGLVGVSISAYELLLYQLLQVPGGAFDRLIAMSVLGTSIMYAYRVLSPWLLDYLRFTKEELKAVAHIHWAFSSCLLLSATFTPIANHLTGLGAGVFLIRYAIFQGRCEPPKQSVAEIWVYLGLLEVAGMRSYWLSTAIGRLFAEPLLPWSAPLASVVAYFLYILPWERWGWSKKPWQNTAYILPIIFLWESREQISPVGLLIVAAFYVFVALLTKKFRFTYISVIIIDWALFRWFSHLNLTDALWYVTPFGLSLLYIAQFDQNLKLPKNKDSRHFLRLLGSSVICGLAIIFHQDTALIPGIFSLIAIFAGLALRVRAFLYVGVATFFITSVYHLVVLSLRYAFLKWIVGLLVGIVLIAIAAKFETRREQLNSLIRNTTQDLETWE